MPVFIIMLLFLCTQTAVYAASSTEIIKTGAAVNIVDKYDNNPLWPLEGNGTFLQTAGGDVYMFYSDASNDAIHRRTATDADAKNWVSPTVVQAAKGSWYTICKDPDTGIIYALGTTSAGNRGEVYASKSVDGGTTFTPINNNQPVLTNPTDLDHIWYHRWNLKLVIVNGVFHLWMDTAYGIGSIGGSVPEHGVSLNWGQAYSYSPLGPGDTLNFDLRKSSQWAIPQGNALEAIYIPERGAIFFLDSHFFSPTLLDGHGGLYSGLIAWSAPAQGNLSKPANYTRLDFGMDGGWYPPGEASNNRRSVSDPAITSVLDGKTSKLILSYNYDQESQAIEYSNMTLVQLYDAAGGQNYLNPVSGKANATFSADFK